MDVNQKAQQYRDLEMEEATLGSYAYGHGENDARIEAIWTEKEAIRMEALESQELADKLSEIDNAFGPKFAP